MRVRRLLRLRRQLVLAIAIPVVVKGVTFAADELRQRKGHSRVADRLEQAGRLLRKVQQIF